MEKNQYQKKKEADGYVVVEAAVLLPLASIFIVLLIGLCSYLYQGCFLMQAAYTVAFRRVRHRNARTPVMRMGS